MRLDIYRALLIAASLLAISFPVSSQPSPVDVVERLKAGSAVIYFRHGDTKVSVSRLPGCESERNLSETGRDEMRLINAALREIGLPISEVLSSPFCRTRETALIAFGQVQVAETLRSANEERDEEKRRTPDLLRLLTTPPTGAIRVLVAHHSNLIAAVGIALQEGEAAVFTPPASPGEGPRLFARVKPAEWPELATVAKR
jgi:phosphohistidine phosphatase SixA